MNIARLAPACKFTLALFLTSIATASTADACAQALPKGAHAAVATEEAAIVWDEGAQAEHFIRHASFESDAKDFGFLVPTPEAPILSETSPTLFDELDDTFHPRYIRKPLYGLKPSLLMSMIFPTFGKAKMPVSPSTLAVKVLRTQQVAGYDATVLRADDADALARWLRIHGYEARPALTQWLQPYVQRHWTITAFKIAGSPGSSETTSSAVQMTFHTPRPFFPYSEPADQRSPGGYAPSRLLRVFLLSSSRMDAHLDSPVAAWPGQVSWAKVVRASQFLPGKHGRFRPYDPNSPQRLFDAETGGILSAVWLTAFEDTSSPRPGVADIYFQPSKTQTPVEPQPVYFPVDKRIPIPIDLLGVGAIVGLWFIRRRKANGAP